jgi:hypothetical protein
MLENSPENNTAMRNESSGWTNMNLATAYLYNIQLVLDWFSEDSEPEVLRLPVGKKGQKNCRHSMPDNLISATELVPDM